MTLVSCLFCYYTLSFNGERPRNIIEGIFSLWGNVCTLLFLSPFILIGIILLILTSPCWYYGLCMGSFRLDDELREAICRSRVDYQFSPDSAPDQDITADCLSKFPSTPATVDCLSDIESPVSTVLEKRALTVPTSIHLPSRSTPVPATSFDFD